MTLRFLFILEDDAINSIPLEEIVTINLSGENYKCSSSNSTVLVGSTVFKRTHNTLQVTNMSFSIIMNDGQYTGGSYATMPTSVGVNAKTPLYTVKSGSIKNEKTVIVMMSIASDLKTVQVFTNYSGNITGYTVKTLGQVTVNRS